jgi:isopentenyl-diphosphate Delta-isomerase
MAHKQRIKSRYGIKHKPKSPEQRIKKTVRESRKIMVVDENDWELDPESRAVVDRDKLRYRVSALWLKNSNGQVLLARRALTKSHDPGKWGPAVAGTVEDGENYRRNIDREAFEELGITSTHFHKGPKTKHDGEHRYFVQWFTAIINRPSHTFKIQKKEVAEVRWFSVPQIKKMFEERPQDFIHSFGEELRLMEL